MTKMKIQASCRKGLQVCLVLLMVGRLQGKVTAPERLEAPVEKPFTLTCSVSRERGWVSVMKAATPASLTCILPVRSRDGRASLLPVTQITVDSNKTAVSGKKASLSCSYGLPEKVQQIVWKHTSAQGDSTEVASFAKRSDPMIEPSFQGRVWLSASLSDSQLIIQPVSIQDEGCYTCLYDTHPDGPKASRVCLVTYVLPKPQVSYKTSSAGVIEANCTSVSRPPAEIVWNVERDNRTMGPPVTTLLPQGDGTTLVISTLTVQSGLLKDVSIKCLVHHKGLESPIAVSMNTKIGTALTILISVTTAAALLVLSLCFCLWKCFLHKEAD
ncbi:OX-2 membrane glycoprotein isoform X2 [Clinocottus analis]|uniref:OX-2 membrane glycoprotein isoform X2 n=1 Tax=Clinocottus analis TaxID=304258 RepID=UPI0035BECF38